jgi:hypothetical protein
VATVWLPKGFEFLSGLPERKRRKRPIVIFQAYIDDSGSKNDGPLMVIAAIVGPAEVWAAVSEAWERELRSNTPGRLAYFKEDEAHHLRGEFIHWRAEARDQKVQRLAKIIDRPELFVAWFGVDLDAHRGIAPFAGHPLKGVKRHGGNQPYLLLMPGVMMAAAAAALDKNPDNRLELILDEHNVFKPDILDGYMDMLRALVIIDPDIQGKMPSHPGFRDDKEWLPLQAADLIAGGIRRIALGDKRHVIRTLTKIRVWPGSKVLGGQDMLRYAQAHTKKKLGTHRVPRPQRKAGKKKR